MKNAVLSLLLSIVCLAGTANAGLFRHEPKMVLTPAVPLIKDAALTGWTNNAGKQPGAGWSVENGTLHLKGKGGDLYTEKQYKNFVLDFSWKITKGGNSGIKYRLKNFDGKGWLGIEYQVLDDFNTGEGKKDKNNTATLYDVFPVQGEKTLNPHTELNHGRIIVNGNRIQHFLNGKKTIDVIVGSQKWKDAVAESKFKDVEGFGKNPVGFIHLQDHNSEVWFQDITIREIKPAAKRFQFRKNRDNVRQRKVQFKIFR